MNTASIIIECPDRPGIIKEVTEFLFFHGGNISYLEQHIEGGMFFMRIEWELDHFVLKTEQDFIHAFSPLQTKHSMQINLQFAQKTPKVGLFCSKELHCLADIFMRVFEKELNIEIAYVLSNFEHAEALTKKFSLPFYYVPAGNDRTEHEQKVLEIIKKHDTDLIAFARYMRIVSADFIQKVSQPVINVHHSFLPSFIGANPYQQAYERGVKLIGATSHFVTEELDEGPIIEQRVNRVRHSYKEEQLQLMGKECEREVFAFALKKFSENKLRSFQNRVIVFE